MEEDQTKPHNAHATSIRLNKEDRKNIDRVKKLMKLAGVPEHQRAQSDAIRWALREVGR